MNDITPEEATRIAPLAPANLIAKANDDGRVQLSWPSTGEDIAYYQCLRRPVGAPHWQQIGQANPSTVTFVDDTPDPDTAIYGVQAVNARGMASGITESQPVKAGR